MDKLNSDQHCDLGAVCEIPEGIRLLLYNMKKEEHAMHERRRYHRDHASHMADILAPAPSAEDVYFQGLRYFELYKAMQELPDKQYRRLYAHFFLGLSITQIAIREGVSIAAVSRSIHRGIETLRLLIGG